MMRIARAPQWGKICTTHRLNSVQALWQTWVGGVNFCNQSWQSKLVRRGRTFDNQLGHNGSGTRTGGTSEAFEDFKLLPMETWMGAWATHVNHFSSMVRTLDSSLVFRMKLSVQPKAFDAERRLKQSRVTQVGPCREAGLLELHSGCQVEAIHLPGHLMTGQGSDDLSWGAWIDP